MRKNTATLLFAALLLPAAARCQLVEEYKPPAGQCCLPSAAQRLADQLQDWNQLGRYHADNERLKAQPAEPGRVVFLGDSITDLWKLAESFPGKPYVNRGISGQTTPQILLAGTNDISANTGPETLTMVEENIQAITELAQVHGIKVILCSLTPVSDYTRFRQTERRPPADILRVNAWLKEYAAQANAVFADYYAVLVDDKGMLKDGYSGDGLHPNAKGYELMGPVAEAAIGKALR
jgi:lysophospholipase L1-like esterase